MINQILETFISSPAFQQIAGLLTNDEYTGENLQLPRAVRLPFLAAVYQALNRPLLLITDRSDHALTILDELKLWLPAAPLFLFPEPNALFYEKTPWGMTIRRERLTVLTRLTARQIPGAPSNTEAPIIVTPARAVMIRTLPKREFIRNTRILKTGQRNPFDKIISYLIALGYQPTNLVTQTGQFARRGGILDFWSPANTSPVRVEFFGDEIETLRTFKPADQLTIRKIERVLIAPAREYILNKSAKPGGTDETEELSEFHIPLLTSAKTNLLDYLPNQSLVMIDDFETLRDSINTTEEQALRLREDNLREGLLPENYPVPYSTWDQIIDDLPPGRTVLLGPVGLTEDETTSPAFSAMFSTNPRFGGQLKSFIQYLRTVLQKQNRVFLVSRQAARLKEVWKDNQTDLTTNPPVFIHGNLSEGWQYSSENGAQIHLLTDGEIFGWRRPIPRKRPQPAAKPPESAYADFKTGDWVVHVDHGIGKFQGLVQRVIENTEREYLCIEYAENDQLFVPVHQADRLSRYIGPDNRAPKMSRLGGGDWQNTKTRVTEAVEKMAEDLLELYAKRQQAPGFAFSPDNSWQQELEASFPYIETDDQIRVITEVKQDMESPRPMDRLICGDVGYGKTEVALRAAFKAVLDGKQVALLVPTTVLAQQHYQTFSERLSPFPVEVEMLSRFRNPKQQREILKKLSRGSIDIIIGTHRLLSSDVEFKDLGLLIIDEEQRFGVTHKEQLKKMRIAVDVLTMTATPIPRTLYLTLTGIRDISTINTPPEERLPIVTHVGPYDTKLVRKAILRELERGGQVFFVHNRVQTIRAMREHLRKLVPEAQFAIAHGQMQEKELSRIMKAFTSGEVDVLLSTTIIESGLDIPNANTLIIDRADTFGLSQLYQLRGRVGRGAQRAYAYFFKHNKRAPTPEGQERLETIAENTQLGAGFTIAMRDLEIRGAGDILGTRQHGHIASVGFHLYTRLLSEAIQRLRNDKPAGSQQAIIRSALIPMVSVDLPMDVGIPAAYIPDREVRLGLYRRIATLSSVDETDLMRKECSDRFGRVPQPLDNLLYQIKVKLLAEQSGISAIIHEHNKIILRYPESSSPPVWIERNPAIRTGKHRIWLSLEEMEGDWQQHLLTILASLAENRKH